MPAVNVGWWFWLRSAGQGAGGLHNTGVSALSCVNFACVLPKNVDSKSDLVVCVPKVENCANMDMNTARVQHEGLVMEDNGVHVSQKNI